MKRILLAFLCIMLLIVGSVNAKDKNTDEYRYDVEGIESVSNDGHQVMLRVWSYGKKNKLTREICMRNAVHAVIFKGIPATSGTGVYQGAPAIVPAGYDSDRAYFDNFFNSGDYLQYVTIANHGNMLNIKLPHGEFKIGIEFMVNRGALEERLIKDKKAESLDFLF